MTVDARQIDAMPTKAFFVDMLVRDISLDRAVLDLVDNCVDGAKRLRSGEEPDFSDLSVSLSMNEERFEIVDNCGGFDIDTARRYAFRFGRPVEAESTDYSIGQFGVGMKRALFKFGRYFEVHSATETQSWSMKVDVAAWEHSREWVFNFDEVDSTKSLSNGKTGTRILVLNLRPEVASQFSSVYFQRRLGEMLRSHQRQFLAWGLDIDLAGLHLTNTDLRILSGGTFSPAVEELEFDELTNAPVTVRIVVGLAGSVPSEAGWYVVCNGRVVLAADRSEETGWGRVAEQADGIPKFHNQYARFRGAVFFDCRSSRKLPWNTTKTGLDASSAVWQAVMPKMLDHTRAAIRFLNLLDDEIAEYGQLSPTLAALSREASPRAVETLRGAKAFSWNRAPRAPGPRTTSIQYSRQHTKIQALMTALGVSSARAVGEATFDIVYDEQGEDDR